MNATTSNYDVIVVGARVAGAATAMLLAREGMRVAVIERAPYGTDTISTHALMRGGVLQLTRWGLLEPIVAATPAIRTTVYNYGGRRREIAIKPAHGVDALYAPRRTLLDPVIADGARRAGAELNYGCRVTGLVWESGRVVGVRTSGMCRDRELRAPLVVGADGVRSIVARDAGAHEQVVGRWCSGITYGYWRDIPAEGYEWTFHPDACTGVIPTGNGLVCVFAGGRPRTIGRGGEVAIRTLARTADPGLAERLDAAGAPVVTRTFRGVPGYLRRCHGPGWALVGDAGYFKDPIVAHGMTDGLRDAELLARAVSVGFDGDLTEALEHYEETRNRLSLPLFETADRIASQQWDDAELDDLVRRISSATADEVDLLTRFDQPVPEGSR